MAFTALHLLQFSFLLHRNRYPAANTESEKETQKGGKWHSDFTLVGDEMLDVLAERKAQNCIFCALSVSGIIVSY